MRFSLIDGTVVEAQGWMDRDSEVVLSRVLSVQDGGTNSVLSQAIYAASQSGKPVAVPRIWIRRIESLR